MTIVCPECGTPYRLSTDMAPTQKSAAKCKKCGTRMIISPEQAEDPGTSQEYPAEAYSQTLTEALSTSGGVSVAAEETVSDETEADPSINESDGNNILSVFPELGGISTEKFRMSDIFSGNRKGKLDHKTNRLKAKLLNAVAPILDKNILLDNEQVLNIAKGSGYYPWEIPYANGIFTLPTNYFAIVCTNFRLILINIDRRVTSPTRYIYQIFYEEIIRLSRGVFLTSFIIQTRNNRIWNFTSVGRTLARQLIALILSRKKEGASGIYDGTPKWQLCPACYMPIQGNPLKCDSCSSKYKAPSVACKRSFMLPGLGALYLGYKPLGYIELFIYLSSWFFLAVLAYLKLPGIVPLWILMLIILHSTSGVASLKLGQKGVLLDEIKNDN